MTDIISKSEEDTIQCAKGLAATLKPPTIILLNGNLGMGKTVFARALIRQLCNNPTLEVISPTFTLLQTYETPNTTLHHYDLYRIEHPDEILELGWEDAAYDGITIVEWPERLGAYKPREYLDITLTNDHNSDTHRAIKIQQV